MAESLSLILCKPEKDRQIRESENHGEQASQNENHLIVHQVNEDGECSIDSDFDSIVHEDALVPSSPRWRSLVIDNATPSIEHRADTRLVPDMTDKKIVDKKIVDETERVQSLPAKTLLREGHTLNAGVNSAGMTVLSKSRFSEPQNNTLNNDQDSCGVEAIKNFDDGMAGNSSNAEVGRVSITATKDDIDNRVDHLPVFKFDDKNKVDDILNRFKSCVEDLTAESWNWWPFAPKLRLLKRDEFRMGWHCVSLTCYDIQRATHKLRQDSGKAHHLEVPWNKTASLFLAPMKLPQGVMIASDSDSSVSQRTF